MKNGKVIDKFGVTRYYLNNKLHREDGPAIEWLDGDKEWFLNGKKINNIIYFNIELKNLNKNFKI